jgi:hypothetical protein
MKRVPRAFAAQAKVFNEAMAELEKHIHLTSADRSVKITKTDDGTDLSVKP